MKFLQLIRFGAAALICVFAISVPVGAEEIGTVTRSVNMPDYPVGSTVSVGTQIETGDGQRIAIKTEEGDTLIANSNSIIKVEKPGFFSQLFGKIYYFISPGANRQVTVQTRAATIGIRGTKFVVDSNEDDPSSQNVSLVEGKLNFQSNDDERFALYEERELTEYEKFKRERMAEFQAYKQQMMEEFVAYKAEINLDAGFGLRFDGKKVVRAPLPADLDSEIAEFEQFLQDENTKQ